MDALLLSGMLQVAPGCILKEPQVINDDDVNCDIPTSVAPGSPIEIDMFTYIIQTCQFYDRISRQLQRIQALEAPAKEMLDLVSQFHTQLQSWKNSLPADSQPCDRLKQWQMPDTVRSLGMLTIHCSFYDLMMVVHSIFAYPWVTELFSGHDDTNLALQVNAQMAASSDIVANAARSLIVIARNLDMDRAGTQS